MNMTLNDIKWIDLPTNSDDRGLLTAIETNDSIPIEIKRIFYMHQVAEDRGGHAHMDTDQVIIAIHGQFELTVRTPTQQKKFQFNNALKGLYVPRMIFIELYNFTKDAVCLVLANTKYDIKKSYRSWSDYYESTKS